MSIGNEIITILREEILEDETFAIEMEEDLLTSSTLDSMALIRMVAAIEKKYEIKIPPTDLVIENFLNISAIESYINSRLKE